MPEMTPAEVRRFLLEGTRTAKLATTRADGRPHVTPIWFLLDGDDVVFTTHETSLKAKAIRRDPRVCFAVDDQAPPYSFVMVEGDATVSDPAELLEWATRISGRYMGADRAEQYGRRSAAPGELLVRIRTSKIVAYDGVSNFE